MRKEKEVKEKMQCIEEIEENGDMEEPGRALSWRGSCLGVEVWRVYFRRELEAETEPSEVEEEEEHVDVVAGSAASARVMAEESTGWKNYRVVSVSKVEPPFVPGIVRAGYNSCMPTAKTWLGDSDARTLCAVSAMNYASESAGCLRAEPGVYWNQDLIRDPPWLETWVQPSPSRIRSLTGLPKAAQADSLSRLEDQGLIKSQKSPNGRKRLFCWFSGQDVSRSKSAASQGMMDMARVVFPKGRPARLSGVQRDVLKFLVDRGVSGSEITRGLGMSFSTISRCKKEALQKTIETVETVQTPKEIDVALHLDYEPCHFRSSIICPVI